MMTDPFRIGIAAISGSVRSCRSTHPALHHSHPSAHHHRVCHSRKWVSSIVIVVRNFPIAFLCCMFLMWFNVFVLVVIRFYVCVSLLPFILLTPKIFVHTCISRPLVSVTSGSID